MSSDTTSRKQILSNITDEFLQLEARRPDRAPATDTPAYAAALDKTIADLNARIAEERAALEKLKARQPNASASAVHGPSDDPSTQLRHLQSLTKAYKSLAAEPPYLPTRPSALPYLLAHRSTTRQVTDMQAAVPTLHATLVSARQQLADEEADIADNQALSDALRARLADLRRTASASRSQPTPSPEQTARGLIEAAATQSKAHNKQTRQLTRALVRFIESDLGPKLAAEELGGPVAGSAPDVGEEVLAGAAGFAASGRAKKGRPLAEDKRQRRIDEIWGEAEEGEDGFGGEGRRSESEAAAREMRDLVEALLNAAAEHGAAQYVELKRDSAAARFLVRSNVAVLHRTDARRIRLMEFGREIDD